MPRSQVPRSTRQVSFEIDTIAPTVTSVVANPATADLNAGKAVTLTVTFSRSSMSPVACRS